MSGPPPKVELDRSLLYLVESEQDPTVLLALEPHYEDGYMCWLDTVRPRMIEGELVRSDAQSATFQGEDGARYDFRPLTLREYDAHIREGVEGSPSFQSDAELHAFYVKTFLG